jgi:hypothetical protein
MHFRYRIFDDLTLTLAPTAGFRYTKLPIHWQYKAKCTKQKTWTKKYDIFWNEIHWWCWTKKLQESRHIWVYLIILILSLYVIHPIDRSFIQWIINHPIDNAFIHSIDYRIQPIDKAFIQVSHFRSAQIVRRNLKKIVVRIRIRSCGLECGIQVLIDNRHCLCF